MIEATTESDGLKSRPGLPFEQVTSVCASFTQSWDAARRPDLPSYLERVAEASQETLLRNLLEHEVRRRREAGETPTAEEYIGHFPRHAGLIRQVFLESTSSSKSTRARHRPARRWTTSRCRPAGWATTG